MEIPRVTADRAGHLHRRNYLPVSRLGSHSCNRLQLGKLGLTRQRQLHHGVSLVVSPPNAATSEAIARPHTAPSHEFLPFVGCGS